MDKKAILILMASILAAGVYCYLFFGGYSGSSDACDYGGLARNIIEGNGFTINHIYPLSLVFNPQIPQPNCIWPPLYPLILALGFLAFGISDLTLLAANIFLFSLLSILTYTLARKYLEPKKAILSLIFIGFSQFSYYIIMYGTAEILAAIFIISSIIILDSHRKNIVIAAIFFGLGILTRYQILFLLPLYLIFIGKSYRKLIIFAIVALAVCLPWLIRNFIVFGNPIFTLQQYGEYTKGIGLAGNYYYTYQSLEPSNIFTTISTYPLEFIKKIISGVPIILSRLPLHLNSFSFYLVIWAIIFFRSDKNLSKIIKFTFYGLIIYLFICLLDGQHHRHFYIFDPLFALLAAAGFNDLITRTGLFKPRYARMIFLLFFLLPFNFPEQELNLRDQKSEIKQEHEIYRQVSQRLHGNVASDASDALWWYEGLNTVWLPANLKTLIEVDSLIGIQAVYIQDSQLRKRFSTESEATFNVIFTDSLKFSDGSILYLKSN